LYRKLKKHETEIVCRGLKYFDKLVIIEEKEYNEYKEETRREPQLPVSSSRMSTPTNTSLYDLQVDLPMDSDSAEALAAFDPLNPY
jgi:hypothetical protein